MTILPAAIGIILSKDKNQVLLVKRQDVPVWVLPGGGIDKGESAETAVLREAKEETGLVVEIERKCSEYIPQNKITSHTHIFLCTLIEGTLQLSDETAEIKFFPLKHLPKNFFPLHKRWLTEALNSPTFFKKPLEGVSCWECLKYVFKHPYCTFRYLFTRLLKR